MASTPHDGAGTTLTLNGTSYTVTNIVISYTNPNTGDNALIDVSHLGLLSGDSLATMSKPLTGSTTGGTAATGRQVQFDYLGKTIIADAATGTCTIVTGGTTLLSGVAYTVSASTLTLATNDAIRGQATIAIARV